MKFLGMIYNACMYTGMNVFVYLRVCMLHISQHFYNLFVNAVLIHQPIERMVEIYTHLYIHLCMHKIPH